MRGWQQNVEIYVKVLKCMFYKKAPVVPSICEKCQNLINSMYCCCWVPRSSSNLCNPMDCSTRSFPVLHYLLELTQTHVHWVGDAIQPSHPLSSLLLLPSIFPSIRVFSNESVLHIMWPKDWSFSFGICSSNDYSGLISFRMDWLVLLAAQETLKSLLPHHSSKALFQRLKKRLSVTDSSLFHLHVFRPLHQNALCEFMNTTI